jgi:hypothetical protein
MKPQEVKSILAWNDTTIKLVRVPEGFCRDEILKQTAEDLGIQCPYQDQWAEFTLPPEQLTESSLDGFVHKSVHDELAADADRWTNRFRLADAMVFRLLTVMSPPGEEDNNCERAIRAEMNNYRQQRLDQEAIIDRQKLDAQESK